MSFIRTKEIPPGSGNFYQYRQTSKRVDGKVTTVFLGYIGVAPGGETGIATVKQPAHELGITTEAKINSPFHARAENLYDTKQPSAEKALKFYGEKGLTPFQRAGVEEIEKHLENADKYGLDPEKVKFGATLAEMEIIANDKLKAYNKRAGVRALQKKIGTGKTDEYLRVKTKSPGYGSRQAHNIANATGKTIH